MPNSSMQDMIRNLTIRSLRKTVRILWSLTSSEVGHVDAELLSDLSIVVSPLSLDLDNEIDFDPKYFIPYPREKFAQIYTECFGGDRDILVKEYFLPGQRLWQPPTTTAAFGNKTWQVYEHEAHHCHGDNSSIGEEYARDFDWLLDATIRKATDESEEVRLIHYTNWWPTSMNFQEFGWHSSQRYPSGRNGWKLYGQFILGQDDSQPGSCCDPDLPHSQCFVIHDAPFSNGPLKSEILGITMSMYEKMSDEYYNNHRLFPILCYTFNGPSVRVTQACLDGNVLQLRQTEPIDIGSGVASRDNVKMLLRCMMCTPALDTRWVSTETEENLQAVFPEIQSLKEVEVAV